MKTQIANNIVPDPHEIITSTGFTTHYSRRV